MRRRDSIARARLRAESRPSLRARRSPLRARVDGTDRPGCAASLPRKTPGSFSLRARRCRRRNSDTKWISRSTRCAGQISPPVQRRTTSPGGRRARLPQAGQWSGNANGLACFGRGSRTTERICGITSPGALATIIVSPTRTSLRAISSSLCRVARSPARRRHSPVPVPAMGVSAPVRPTWMRISCSTVVACSAGNFHPIAQRGARPAKPRRRWSPRSSSL